jgi:hypothetical protein
MAFASIVELDNIADGKSYSDLTGRLPAKSEAGNLYVLVLYTYDDNAILAQPLPRRSDAEQLKAYTKILERARKGSELKMHWMDNEASKAVKDLLTKEFKLEYQLVPPLHPPTQCSRARNPNFQEPLYRGTMLGGQRFPNTSMGSPDTPSGNHAKPTVSIA